MSHIATTMQESIEVTAMYLGGSRVQAQTPRQVLRLPAGCTVGGAVEHIAQMHPALKPLLPQVRWACNMEFVQPDHVLRDGDEVALLPPVCGGVGRTQITAAPIDVANVINSVQAAHLGATVNFLGTVRNHNHGHAVASMVYEAYRPMADRELEKIADRCAQQQAEVRIVHRIGSMAVGDVSVVIAAASVHREAAFDACRAALEGIKHQVPIWKREHTPTGDVWVGWGGG